MESNMEAVRPAGSQRSSFASQMSRSASTLSRTSSNMASGHSHKKVKASGWTKHLEDGVFHEKTPLTTLVSSHLKAMLNLKDALQCLEEFVMDLQKVPNHSAFKKGYNLKEIKPIAGEYVGRFEKLGVAMFFCSFTDKRRIPHQWFEFVDREANPNYRPLERVDLPIVNYPTRISEEEVNEQEGLGKCSGSTEAGTSVDSNDYTDVVILERGGTNNSHGEEDLEEAGQDHIMPIPICLRKPVMASVPAVSPAPSSTRICCVPGEGCNSSAEVSVDTIDDQPEPSVKQKQIAAAELAGLWAKVVDNNNRTDT